MIKQPRYVSTYDSAVMISVPVHMFEYITDDGVEGKVFLEGGRYHNYRKDDDEFDEIINFGIENSFRDVNNIICSILGIDDCNTPTDSFGNPKGYIITKIDTIYVYESHADGSSA